MEVDWGSVKILFVERRKKPEEENLMTSVCKPGVFFPLTFILNTLCGQHCAESLAYNFENPKLTLRGVLPFYFMPCETSTCRAFDVLVCTVSKTNALLTGRGWPLPRAFIFCPKNKKGYYLFD